MPRLTPEQREARAEEKRRRQELAGIPESAPPIAAEGEFEENELLRCHVNGVLYTDLPLVAQSFITYKQTDEGIVEAEALARHRNGDHRPSNVQVEYRATEKVLVPKVDQQTGESTGGYRYVDRLRATSPEDKALQQRREDVRDRGMDLSQAKNVMAETAKRYAKPGMRPKFLTTRNGELNPDYEVVKKANGDPVRYKGMILGHVPEDIAVEKTRTAQARSAAKMKQLTRRHQAEGGVPAEKQMAA